MKLSRLIALVVLFEIFLNVKAQAVSNPVGQYGWLDQHSLDTSNNFTGNEACIPSSTVNGLTYLQNLNPSLFGTNLTGSTNISSTQGLPNSYNNWVKTDQMLIGLAGTEPNNTNLNLSGGTSVLNDIAGTKVYLLRIGYYSDITIQNTNASILSLNYALTNHEAVVGVIEYTNGGGHGIMLNGLDWSTASSSGTLYFVDPLNPSENYSDSNVLGPVYQTSGTLTQQSNNTLFLQYQQLEGNNLLPPYSTNTHQVSAYLVDFITLSITPSTNTNPLWSNLVIGSNSIAQTNIISSGIHDFSNTIIGYATNSSNNLLIVTNTGTLLSNSVNLYVGNYGPNNRMVISDGGVVAGEYGVVGNYSNSSNNSVLVTGMGSIWTNSGDIAVGFDGSGNSLVISNGGKVLGGSDGIGGIIGADTGSSNNWVQVTGANSTWSNSLDLYIGFGGSSNSLVISNQAVVRDSNGIIGNYYLASNNSVLVTGTNSLWKNDADLYVGNYGSSNSLVISNGAHVTDINGWIGFTNKATITSNNNVTVTGGGSLWSNSGSVVIGNEGSSNSLVISNAGAVIATGIIETNGTTDGPLAVATTLGYSNTSSNNSILITGTNSVMTNAGRLRIGYDGSGNSVIVSNGAHLIGTRNANITLGFDAGSSNNRLIITGSNSLSSNNGGIYVGYSGSGNSMTLSNGAVMLSGSTNPAFYGSDINYNDSYVGFYAGPRINCLAAFKIATSPNSNLAESKKDRIDSTSPIARCRAILVMLWRCIIASRPWLRCCG